MNLEKRKIPTNIGITGKLLQEIDTIAAKEGLSRSELVNTLIELGLKQYKPEK